MNRGLPARMLVRYFDRSADEWVVKPEIRRMCSFRQSNLCASLAFKEPFDVILLRNVMLYLAPDSRASLLRAMHRSMAPDGFLFLGSAGQVPEPSLWTTISSGNGASYYRPL